MLRCRPVWKAARHGSEPTGAHWAIGSGATHRREAVAISPRTTTWATSSSRCFSTRPWPTRAGSFHGPTARSTKRRPPSSTRICRKLELKPSDHLLEIGTGWGGFALYAAQHYGCRVTTTTISRKQYEFSRQQIAAAGLADRVSVLNEDYRAIQGSYDKLVSIEMIEAVGHRYFDTYFRLCSQRLKPHGMMLLQAIVIPDQRYDRYRRSVDFIQRYIFPGGCLPSVGAIRDTLDRVTDFRLFHLEDITPHYAETLALWRQRFRANLTQVRGLGFSDEFIRTWEYYFGYCEGGFRERAIGDVQMLLTKLACRPNSILAQR